MSVNFNGRHYDSFVSHIMRYYAKVSLCPYPRNPHFRNAVDELNWNACDDVMKQYSPEQREMLLEHH